MTHCPSCNRHFANRDAFDQHVRDSPAHIESVCELCDRSFNSVDALDQHIRDSPAHKTTIHCTRCDKSFSSREALDQHTRDSPSHAPNLDCQECDRSFGSRGALEQHVRDSPAHTYSLMGRRRTFISDQEGLTSRIDQHSPSSLEADLGKLALEDEVHFKPKSYKKPGARELIRQIDERYGTLDKLEGLQKVCQDVGLDEIPTTISQCKKALEGTFVNIYDLLETRKSATKLKLFRSRADLKRYSHAENKIYPKKLAKADTAVKPLLIEMF